MNPQIKNFFLPLACFLVYFCLYEHGVNAQEKNGNLTLYDTVFVYDTIIVFDTIWTEELVYDTVWIYDTIRVMDAFEMGDQLSSQPINLLIQPVDSGYSIRESGFDARYGAQYEAKQVAKSKSRQKSGNSFGLSSFQNSTYHLTLNPFRGSFDASIFKEGSWSLQMYGGMVYHINTGVSDRILRSQNITNITYIPLTGYEVGLKMNYQLAQLLVQTGVGLVNLNEELKYTERSYRLESSMEKGTFYRTETYSDTTIQYHWGNEYPEDDSIYFYIHKYDSLVAYDSIYPVIDSVQVDNLKKEQLNHYLLEVPLLFSWQFGYHRLKLGLKVGGVNQFHLYSSGRTFNNQGELADVNEVITFMKYNLALYGGVDLVYNFSKKVAVGIEAYYKHPIWRFAETSYQSHHKPTYGASIYVAFSF